MAIKYFCTTLKSVALKSDLKFGAFGGAQMNGCRNLEMKTFFFWAVCTIFLLSSKKTNYFSSTSFSATRRVT
jgi:hypothetical protein